MRLARFVSPQVAARRAAVIVVAWSSCCPSPEVWLSFATLAALEIVLGIDNIIFIAILVGSPAASSSASARASSASPARSSRASACSRRCRGSSSSTQPLFHVGRHGFSGKAMILFAGGLFLLYKATKEIHHKLEAADERRRIARARPPRRSAA